MTRRPPPPLVALTTGVPAERARAGLRAAISAGLRGVVLREPDLGDRAFLEAARWLRDELPADGWLALHDRVHLAREGRADAVHLGFRSLAPLEARKLVGEEVAIGFSAHAGDEDAAWIGCDYLFCGPVFDTPSKRGLVEPTGLGGLASAVRRASAPVHALGGVRPEHAVGCLAAGARGIAVLSGVLGAADPARETARYLAALAAEAAR
jgi:thiamine-phosphate pyrophosphorylase